MPRGQHRHAFNFALPESALPCSFESKLGSIRYYLRVTLDIPYSSPPQGIKYFTIIGPHTDCMEDSFLVCKTLSDFDKCNEIYTVTNIVQCLLNM